VAVTVTCVEDAPQAVDDTETVTEDDPATTIDVLANDTDVEDDPITIESVTQPGTAAYVNSTHDAGPVTIFGVIDLSNGVQISSS
jgi:hypothetical protein